MPRRDLTLSTFCIDQLNENVIWEIGQKEIAGPAKKTLYARGDVKVASVPKPLKATLDNNPPRHVNVGGWPVEKEAQLELALTLALAANLFINPSAVKKSVV